MIAPYCANELFFSLLDFEDVTDVVSAIELEGSDVVQCIGRFFYEMSGTGKTEIPLFGGHTFFHERPKLRFVILFPYRQNFCPFRQIERKIILHRNSVLMHALHCNASFSLVNVQFDAKLSIKISIAEKILFVNLRYKKAVLPYSRNLCYNTHIKRG